MPYLQATPPHLRDADSVSKIMWRKAAALLPVAAASFWAFRLQALVLILAGLLGGLLAEGVGAGAFRKRLSIHNGSTVLFSLLFAFLLPPSLPAWAAFLGAFLAVGIGKEMCGGVGSNLFHPALVGLLILKMAFPLLMLQTRMLHPAAPVVSMADFLEKEIFQGGFLHRNIYLGMTASVIGTGSLAAILAGAFMLHFNRTIYPEIPWIYLGAILLGLWSFGKNPLDAVWAGNILLVAFWIATDDASTPASRRGKRWFAFWAGLLGVFLNECSIFYDGALAGILIMNGAASWLDEALKPRAAVRAVRKSYS